MTLSDLIIHCVQEFGKEHNSPGLIKAQADTLLFGEHLDSMGVVFLVTELESRLADELDVEISLADERAMSQKTSPFRSVKHLTDYIELLVNEQVS